MQSKSVRTLFMLALVLMVATVALAESKITVENPVKDFGTVAKGEMLEWTFQVKNTGANDLEILKVQPACGCTVADFDSVIRPGTTGDIKAVVDTNAFNGPISKSVTITSNDPTTPTTMVTIKAVVQPFVEAWPAGFLRYNILQGQADKQSVVIFSEEETSFEVTRIEVPGSWAKAEFEMLGEADRVNAGRKGQNQYRVDVTVGGPDVPVGPLVDKIYIHSNSVRQPVYTLNLAGIVRPSYNVMPTVLNFGEVNGGDVASSRVVTVMSNDREAPGSFMIEKVESTIPGVLVVNSRATETPGRYEIEVRVRDGAKAGNVDGQLKIYTTDMGTPVFTLPVKGVVKG